MNVDGHLSIRELVYQVVGCAHRVANGLGCGFLEKVYERAMEVELRRSRLDCKAQVRYPVKYLGHNVGDYYADLVVENQLVLELKCVESFADEHLAQCLNYLRASGLRSALLINFQHPRVQWRKVGVDSSI